MTFCDCGVTITMLCNYYNKAGAAYSSGTTMVVAFFLLNNRYQFFRNMAAKLLIAFGDPK